MTERPISAEAQFEEILQGLQTVVEQLEQGDLPLEQSLRLFEQGMKLSQLGTKRLDEAESKIEQLLAAGESESQDRPEVGGTP